tara:strand:- start:13277 stop:13939 length:663 start_codon:yes stop_codon:yes gene_type:complete
MDDGEGLRSQTLALEEYALGQGMKIEIVPGSEPGHGPIAGRPRFREAIQKAEERGWKLLVTNPSRLSREADHLKYIDLRKTPVWILREGQVTKERLLKGIEIAARELLQLRADGAAGALKHTSGYRTEEAKINARDGRIAGAKSNGDRAFRNRLRVQEFIERNAGAAEMTHQQLVDALNTSGTLNCVSERKQTNKPWTIQALRPVRKDVMEQIALDAEPD